MELKEIITKQDEFDRKHASKFEWSESITDDTIDILVFLIIAITGEVGELSNVIKKIMRGDIALESARENIENEIADIFI